MRFEPQGHTKNPDIRIAKSLIDYIFRWLGITFLPGYKEASLGVTTGKRRASEPSDADSRPRRRQEGRRSKAFGLEARKTTSKAATAGRGKRHRPKAEARRDKSNGETATLAPPQANGHATATPTATQTATRNGHANGNGNGEINIQLLCPRRRHAQRRRPHHRPQRAVRRLPIGRPGLRQLRRDHRPQRQLLPLPQLRQQHGLQLSS